MRILVSSMLLVMFALSPYTSSFAGDGVKKPLDFNKVFRVDSRP